MILERNQKRVAIFLCSAALVLSGGAAFARTHHHHRSYHRQTRQPSSIETQTSEADLDQRYQPLVNPTAFARAKNGRVHRRRTRIARSRWQAAQSHANSAYGGYSTNELVADARRYIGTNPTGRRSLWCGAFMDMVLKQTGHKGGGDLASAYLHYGRRVSGPQVGAIAVMSRRGGGHVGVVSGVDASGNPIIVSGNHNDTVAESVYPRGRIEAYVVPSN
jgi:uncharacterized protein (TIGR02594 family)